jgi:hypothetical protein
MEIFFPKVHFSVGLIFVFIPHDPGSGFVNLFGNVISKCCHDQKTIKQCEDSTNFCLIIVAPTHVEPKHGTKFVVVPHFEPLAAPAVDLCELFSKRFHRFQVFKMTSAN